MGARPKGGLAVIIALLILVGFFACTAKLGERSDNSDSRSTDTSEPASAAPAAAPTAETESYDSMPGDGTYEMGGVDGKNWGVYQADGGPNCQWSIRSVAPYRPGLIFDAGTEPRVSIQPDGDVDVFSGQIDDDHNIVFMTSGCGAWRMQN